MPAFDAPDGTRLAYHLAGDGAPLVCLPGGPMLDSAYLGDLGGLDAHRALVRLDLRGTGASAVPADPASYRVDRQVADVEALRTVLGLDRVDLAAHSAGATLALLYAARHPGRLGRLVLIDPSPMAAGVEITDADRRAVAELRRGEPWFPDAFAAFERIWAGGATAADWLLIAGAYDVSLPPERAAAYAALFRTAELAVQPGGGHLAWLDDPQWFVRTTTRFLD